MQTSLYRVTANGQYSFKLQFKILSEARLVSILQGRVFFPLWKHFFAYSRISLWSRRYDIPLQRMLLIGEFRSFLVFIENVFSFNVFSSNRSINYLDNRKLA